MAMRQGVAVAALLAAIGLPVAFFAEGGWDGLVRDARSVASYRPFQAAPARRADDASPTATASPSNFVAASRNAALDGAKSTATAFARGTVKSLYGEKTGASSLMVQPDDPRYVVPPQGSAPDITGDIRASVPKQSHVRVASIANPTDYGSALKRYALATDPGNAAIRLAIARDYLDATKPDYAEGTRWLRSAADLGNGPAALELSGLYLEGKGIERNYPQAYLWAEVAARWVTDPNDASTAVNRADRLYRAMTLDERVLAETLIAGWKVKTLTGPDDPAVQDLLDPFEDG